MIEFGDYVKIRNLNSVPEYRIYKVIGTSLSNYYVDVPIHFPATMIFHDKSVEIASCICCGVSETEVLKYRTSDIIRWTPQWNQ